MIVALIAVPPLAHLPAGHRQRLKPTEKGTAASPETDTQKKNLQVYVDLLRKGCAAAEGRDHGGRNGAERR